MRDKEISEGLGELADVAERDHEVQMARAELYKLAKYAIKLHDMLKGVSEAEGLEGWVQSKITKSADMIGSVYHHMDYDESPMSEEPMGEAYSPGDENEEGMVSNCCGAPIMDVYQGHGRCSDCKEMAKAVAEESVNEAGGYYTQPV